MNAAGAAALLDAREALRRGAPRPGELMAEIRVTVNGGCWLRIRAGNDAWREFDERQARDLSTALTPFERDEDVVALMALLMPGIARLRSVWWLRNVLAQFADFVAYEARRPEGSRRGTKTVPIDIQP